MELYGDVFVTEGDIGGQIKYVNGQPIMDGGLETTVYLSLFSNDFWGNEITNNNSEQLSEGLDAFLRSKVTSQTRLQVIDRSNNLLQWMLDIGLADTIEVDAFLEDVCILIEIKITKNSEEQSFKYAVNWNNEINNPAIERFR